MSYCTPGKVGMLKFINFIRFLFKCLKVYTVFTCAAEECEGNYIADDSL